MKSNSAEGVYIPGADMYIPSEWPSRLLDWAADQPGAVIDPLPRHGGYRPISDAVAYRILCILRQGVAHE